MPAPLLRNLIVSGLESDSPDAGVGAASHFLAARLADAPQSALASRLSLNCAPSRVADPSALADVPVTVISALDSTALSAEVQEGMNDFYPHAKVAHLKSGGNFPFLSRSDEICMHLLVHVRNFEDEVKR